MCQHLLARWFLKPVGLLVITAQAVEMLLLALGSLTSWHRHRLHRL